MEYGSQCMETDDEFEKLLIRMNPPRVTVDNTSSLNATLIKVDSVNKHGILLEVVQVLTDLNLTIKRAYISSDGEWFMDVFYVVDQHGDKLSDSDVIDRIQRALEAREFILRSLQRSMGVQADTKHTSFELTGRDRPGLISEIFAILTDLKCNVVASEIWTHNSRMAAVVYITDEATGSPIENSDRLNKIKHLLKYVLKGDRDKRGAGSAISIDSTHTERRLHQMMYADRDYDREPNDGESDDSSGQPVVSVENYADKGYSVVNVKCKDRPKLLFDTVCTLTDMQYVVFHATVNSETPVAYQEYYIKHLDGCPVSSEGERLRIIHCLEAAIKRRSYEGIRLELCAEDRVGLLSDAMRIFREHGLTVTRAEVATRGTKAMNVFFVADASGNPVQSCTIDAVRCAIGETILHVKEEFYPRGGAEAAHDQSGGGGGGGRFSLGSLFRTRSEKLLYNLGLIR